MQVQKPDKKCNNSSPPPAQPFFSLLIPVYNTESYIARCLESCIAQSFTDIEILVIDDCGQDNAIEITKDYANKDPRIQILHNPHNLGLFHTRGVGIKQARGKYILHVDSDDFIAPETCQRLHERITQDYASSGVYSDICCFGMDYYPKTFKRIRPVLISQTLHKEQIKEDFFIKPSTPPWHICAKAIKASIAQKANSFIKTSLRDLPPIIMAEDLLHFFIITLFAEKSIGLKEYLYFYCDNENSISRKTTLEILDKRIADSKLIINIFDKLKQLYSSTPTISQSINKIQHILKAAIILESRHTPHAFAYPIACLKSLTLHQKWQTYVRMLLYFTSLGKLKL